jgi:hypothetical protein
LPVTVPALLPTMAFCNTVTIGRPLDGVFYSLRY